MIIQCPKCGLEYDVDNSINGQEVRCQCGFTWIAKESSNVIQLSNPRPNSQFKQQQPSPLPTEGVKLLSPEEKKKKTGCGTWCIFIFLIFIFCYALSNKVSDVNNVRSASNYSDPSKPIPRTQPTLSSQTQTEVIPQSVEKDNNLFCISDGDILGCTDDKLFVEISAFAASHDIQAWTSKVNIGLADGTCILFPKESMVYILQTKVGMVKVRPVGLTNEYWTYATAVKPVPIDDLANTSSLGQ